MLIQVKTCGWLRRFTERLKELGWVELSSVAGNYCFGKNQSLVKIQHTGYLNYLIERVN